MKIAPPQNLEELKNRIIQLNEQGGKQKIGKRTMAALESMMNTPNETSVLTISELARKNDINPSTLTRISKKLGFSGFNEMQNVFRHHMTNGRQYYSNQIGQLLNSDSIEPGESMMHLVAKEELTNTLGILETTDMTVLNAAAKALGRKRQVFILGLRGSYSIAHYFSYYLGMVRKGVRLLGTPGHTMAKDLAEVGKEDVAILINCRPYTRDTVSAFQAIKRIGAQTLSITDNPLSPIAEGATWPLFISNRGPFFFDTTASTLIVVESLLALVAQQRESQTLRELKIRESLIEEMGIDYS